MRVSSSYPGTGLQGRRSECAVLDRLLDGVRAGESAVLVVRGGPGFGKTALLDYMAGRASGFRVMRAWGVESEMELAFAGLHQLCAPMLTRLERLPRPQHNALGVAFGLQEGDVPNRFLVGLAVLTLLADVAEEQPLLCLVDDAQWLDQVSLQCLAFAARRSMAEPIALVFAERDTSGEGELAGLPELIVEGLGDHEARLLLASAVRGRLDVQVRDRIVAETRGNPLALLQLPRGLAPAELAGGFWLPDTRSLASRIEHSFQRQFQSLPRQTQRLLLTAAAEPAGEVALLWRAAERQGIGAEAAAPAEAAGLVEVGARVRFRHPLVRSAVYQAAFAADRRAAHRALAEATDPDVDPDRRAWHRAQAAAGPDEAVAAEMERLASRAQARGGAAAAAAFLHRATELTPDPARRAARALAAAQAKFDAGAAEAAYKLLAMAEAGPLDDLQRVRLERLRAQLAFSLRRGSDAPPLLLKAAKRLEPLDPELARETYLEALGAAIFAGRLNRSIGEVVVAQSALRVPPGPRPPQTVDLLLDGLATRFTDGYAAGAPQLKRALHALCRGADRGEDNMHWLWLACRIAPDLWDDEAWNELTARQVQLARDAGALNILPIALTYRAGVCVHAGEFAAAAGLIEEAAAITRATGAAPFMYTSLVLAAWRGQESQTQELIAAGLQDATARGEGRAIALAEYATAVLHNSLGRYEAAFAAAQRACEHEDIGLFGWGLVELVEAGARTGKTGAAADALGRLSERTRASGTEWALGIEARSRALLSEGQAADALYREAVERLARSRIAIHLARGRLLYGEWLRRENRLLDARMQLRAAHQMFSHNGAEAFAERARQELLAAGETVRKRTVETVVALTAQEAQIARLARDGHTNDQIGAQLFISPRTVEWHLGKIFTKLNITSRKDLHLALSGAGRPRYHRSSVPSTRSPS
jgi:DNA-binding CsgD family transcriptional regulator